MIVGESSDESSACENDGDEYWRWWWWWRRQMKEKPSVTTAMMMMMTRRTCLTLPTSTSAPQTSLGKLTRPQAVRLTFLDWSLSWWSCERQEVFFPRKSSVHFLIFSQFLSRFLKIIQKLSVATFECFNWIQQLHLKSKPVILETLISAPQRSSQATNSSLKQWK